MNGVAAVAERDRAGSARVSAGWRLGVACAADVCALLLLFSSSATWEAVVAAFVLHVAGLAPVAAWLNIHESRPALALAFCATLPCVGPLLAELSLKARGELSAELKPRPSPEDDLPASPNKSSDGEAEVRAHLCSRDPDVRASALAVLVQRADRAAVQSLKWALSAGDADLSVYAALALEELSSRAEKRIATLREGAEARPCAETADALRAAVEEWVASGLLDAAAAAPLLQQAQAVPETAEAAPAAAEASRAAA